MQDAYGDMVRDLSERFYRDVTRYTTSAFLRAKLGRALRRRHLVPHIFENAEEALDYFEVQSKSGDCNAAVALVNQLVTAELKAIDKTLNKFQQLLGQRCR